MRALAQPAAIQQPAQAPGAVADLANMGSETRGLLSDLRRAEFSINPAIDPPHASRTARHPASSPDHDTTGSLIGTADLKYYREVARLGAPGRRRPGLRAQNEAYCIATSSRPI